MRVPVQAPALARSHRARLARRYDGRTEGYGVSPSQLDGEEGGDAEGDEAEGEDGESGEEGGNDGDDSSVESE